MARLTEPGGYTPPTMQKMREVRRLMGLSQAALSALVYRSAAAWGDYETGRKRMPFLVYNRFKGVVCDKLKITEPEAERLLRA